MAHATTRNQAAVEDEVCLRRSRFMTGEEEKGVSASDDPMQPAVKAEDLLEQLNVLLDAGRTLEA